MEIIVGRKQDTSQLKVSIGNKEKAYGSLGSVPKSVSRQHFSLTQESEPGIFILRNLNPANETKVNGVNVEQKRVTTGDDITMGVDNYPFDWDAIAEVAPRIYDISYLKEVWDSYHQQKMKIQIQQGRFNAMLTGHVHKPFIHHIGGSSALAVGAGSITICRSCAQIDVDQETGAISARTIIL